jgi:thiamine-monophosphate kinase
MTEFDLIRTYFASQSLVRTDVRVGIGDDAAIVCAPPGMEIVVTTDALVAGVHFVADVDPFTLGHKSLAVNLSDLAAMGAEPAWFLLALTLPEARGDWLQRFAEGMFALARRHNVQLIGGDTTRGPLAVVITALGTIPQGKGMRRSGARLGDLVYLTGEVGDAALALLSLRGERQFGGAEAMRLRERLERPVPRVDEGIALRDLASSAIDVSDGLAADLGHILQASGVGARIHLDAIPLSSIYRDHLAEVGWECALAGGDDYELCLTVPPGHVAAVDALSNRTKVPLTRIGEITSGSELEIYDNAGRQYRPQVRGHDHFASR